MVFCLGFGDQVVSSRVLYSFLSARNLLCIYTIWELACIITIIFYLLSSEFFTQFVPESPIDNSLLVTFILLRILADLDALVRRVLIHSLIFNYSSLFPGLLGHFLFPCNILYVLKKVNVIQASNIFFSIRSEFSIS